MRGSRMMVGALLAMVLPMAVMAAPLPEVLHAAREKPKEMSQSPPGCACHEAGYPRCDCEQGPACRCVRLGQYAHLPTRETCRQNLDTANAWAWAVLEEARASGCYGFVYEVICLGPGVPVAWMPIGETWQSGGWQADQKRLEYDEAKSIAHVWDLALRLQNEEREDRDQVETELRALAGERAYCSGNLPGPIPHWRVPRR